MADAASPLKIKPPQDRWRGLVGVIEFRFIECENVKVGAGESVIRNHN